MPKKVHLNVLFANHNEGDLNSPLRKDYKMKESIEKLVDRAFEEPQEAHNVIFKWFKENNVKKEVLEMSIFNNRYFLFLLKNKKVSKELLIKIIHDVISLEKETSHEYAKIRRWYNERKH